MQNVDAATLGKLVEQHEGKELPLVVWSAKYRQFRGIYSLLCVLAVMLRRDEQLCPSLHLVHGQKMHPLSSVSA